MRAQRQRLQEDAATIAGQIAELDGVLAEFEEVRQEEREWRGGAGVASCLVRFGVTGST